MSRELQDLAKLMGDGRERTRSEIAGKLGRSPGSINRNLARLVELGLLRRDEIHGYTTYRKAF